MRNHTNEKDSYQVYNTIDYKQEQANTSNNSFDESISASTLGRKSLKSKESSNSETGHTKSKKSKSKATDQCAVPTAPPSQTSNNYNQNSFMNPATLNYNMQPDAGCNELTHAADEANSGYSIKNILNFAAQQYAHTATGNTLKRKHAAWSGYDDNLHEHKANQSESNMYYFKTNYFNNNNKTFNPPMRAYNKLRLEQKKFN